MSAPPTRSRLHCGLVAGLLGLALATSTLPAHADEVEVDIPDPAFRACLSERLAARPLTDANLATLPGVTCDSSHGTIHNIAGMEHLSSATSLVLLDSLLRDLSPIEGLADLNVYASGLHSKVDGPGTKETVRG